MVGVPLQILLAAAVLLPFGGSAIGTMQASSPLT